ncbi:MAG: TolC family protein [Pseudomonadales bacterium]|nr:TolC family protein [Pseudomonadales bacterium]
MMSSSVRAGAVLGLALAFVIAPAFADDYFVVLGSFSTNSAAGEAARELNERVQSDRDVTVRAFESSGRRVYRVLTGPYPDRVSAAEARGSMQAGGVTDAWILALSPTVDDSDEAVDVEPVPAPATTPIKAREAGPAATGPSSKESTVSSAPADQAPPGVSLEETVKMALERNLGLQASRYQVKSGTAQVREAKAGLYPNVTTNVRQTAIDQDRAEASFGQAPEFRTSVNVGARQTLYSDRAIAAVQIQELLQKARENDQRKVALDTVLEAGIAFLRLLRTSALAEIVEDDLALTRSNYERAQVRLELGVANKSEVYRWETRLAGSQRELNLALANVAKARIELNEVINSPLGGAFNAEKPDLKGGNLIFAEDQVWQAFLDPVRQKRLKDYWITEALLFAPELDSVRNQRAAQYRRLLAAKRKLRIPEILLSIDATKYVAEDGAGVEEFNLEIPGVESRFDFDTDNFEWSAAVTASLPLYGGGGNRAEVKQAQAESARMDLLYDEALLAIQSAVLKSLAGFQASMKNIELARNAAMSSRNNLELVSTSYERGVVTIIDVLDAQTAALSAELSAANAEYDFLIEYIKLQRAVGRFDIALSERERAAARSRLEPYLR